jgi:peptidylprolyl isomerase
MNAKSGSTVTVHYTGTLDDGTEFDSSKGREPVTFTLGSGQLISGFDTAVAGMSVGEVKDVALSPAEAYGEANPELTQTVPQQAFPEGFEFVVGGQVMGQSPQGPVMATILEVADEAVKLDMNHPMAGKNLNFSIEVLSIEEDTNTDTEE